MLTVLPLFLMGLLVGCLGALTGIGGGIILVPLLTLLWHVPLHAAMGASLIAVVAQSTGAAATPGRDSLRNDRVAIFLETGAAVGAVVGAVLTAHAPTSLLSILFGLLLLFASYSAYRKGARDANTVLDTEDPTSSWADRLQLHGQWLDRGVLARYRAQSVWAGWSTMTVAGFLSGLLGVGAGAVKVIAMDQIMKLPYKVSTATSNMIVGLTAAAGIGIYLKNGFINATLATPVVLGIVLGAMLGTRIIALAPVAPLRVLFNIVVLSFGLIMIVRGLGW